MSAENISKAVKEYDGFLFNLYLILLLWAPIPLGSNRPWSAMLLTFCVAALLLAWLVLYLKEKVSVSSAFYHARWAVLALCGFQLWVFIQAIHFPASLVAFLSPNVFFQYHLAEFNQTASLSLNINQSLKAAVLGLGFTLSFVMALLLVNTKKRKQNFYSIIVISGVIQAVLGLAFVFSNQELIFQIENLFHTHKVTASGTFVNSNHFAGYINICLAIGVGLLVAQFSKQKYNNWRAFFRSIISSLLSEKMRLRIYIMIMLIALVVSLSRMGNMGFFTALALTGILVFLRDKKFSVKMFIFFLSLIIIDVFIISASFGLEELTKKVENTNLTHNVRTEINANSFPMAQKHFWVGLGADAYGVVEPSFNQMPSEALTEHAHNDYFEFLINTGLVGVSFLLLFLSILVKTLFKNFYVLGDGAKNQIDKSDFGLVMLFMYLAIHSFVDFNLQIPAFSFTLLACFAMVFVRPTFSDSTQ